MKLKNLLITAVSTLAIGSSAFAATAPSESANKANATATMSDADIAAVDAQLTTIAAAAAKGKKMTKDQYDQLLKALAKIDGKTPLNKGQYDKLQKVLVKARSASSTLTASEKNVLNSLIADINTKSGKPPVSPIS